MFNRGRACFQIVHAARVPRGVLDADPLGRTGGVYPPVSWSPVNGSTAEKTKKTIKHVDSYMKSCYIDIRLIRNGVTAMNEKDIIRAAMKARGISQKELAEKTEGEGAPPSFVSESLRRKNGMRIDKFAKFLAVMEYEIVVRDPKTLQEWKLVMDE